jgi:hypothetical protein
MKTFKATVKFPVDRVRKTKYGERVKLIARTDDGDIELWDNPNTTLHNLKKGQEIQVLWDGKRFRLLEIPDSNGKNNNGIQPPPPPPPTHTHTQDRQDFDPDVLEWLSIYEQLGRLADLREETKRAATSTIFMTRYRLIST